MTMPPSPASPEATQLPSRLARTAHGNMLLPLYDTVVSRCLLLYGEWAFAEMALLRGLLGPGDVVVDCGAHVGAHSLFFARCVGPTGRVLSFEPQRLLYQHLCANMALNALPNVVPFWAALGEERGMMETPQIDPLRPENLGARRLEAPWAGEENRAQGSDMKVPIMPLDSLNLTACRLIKVDAEGMERAVLAGAKATIREHRPLLYVENNDRQRSAALIDAIDDLGYRMFWHFSPYFRPNNPNKRAENAFPNTADPNMLCLPLEQESQVEGLDPVQGSQDSWVQARERLVQKARTARQGKAEEQ